MKTNYHNYPIKDDEISYDRIAKALLFYKALGYRQIETPWLVSQQAIVATIPVGSEPIESNAGFLVGSGEQGFVQMMLDGTLKPGRYMTVTPCFRDEPVYNELSRQSFVKIELISYHPEGGKTEDAMVLYNKVVNDAVACFFAISEVETFNAVETKEGYDITYNDIELGSYGVRKMLDHVWVYGTGLAEPRFSIATRRASQTLTSTHSGESLQNEFLPQDIEGPLAVSGELLH